MFALRGVRETDVTTARSLQHVRKKKNAGAISPRR
jgi:hypothetical protein